MRSVSVQGGHELEIQRGSSVRGGHELESPRIELVSQLRQISLRGELSRGWLMNAPVLEQFQTVSGSKDQFYDRASTRYYQTTFTLQSLFTSKIYERYRKSNKV